MCFMFYIKKLLKYLFDNLNPFYVLIEQIDELYLVKNIHMVCSPK